MCYASKVDKDFRTHLLALILIPLSLLVYIFLFLSYPDIFSGSNKTNVVTIIIILYIILFIPFLLIKDYFKKKETSLNPIIDSNNGKNTHCFFHNDTLATSTCKNCQKLLCTEDTKKINYYSQNEYCLTCYNSVIAKKNYPLRAVVGGILVEGAVLFMVLSNTYFNISFLNQTTTLGFGGVFALVLIYGYVTMQKKVKSSHSELTKLQSTNSARHDGLNNYKNVITPSESSNLICNKCSSPLPPKNKKCPNCGTSVF